MSSDSGGMTSGQPEHLILRVVVPFDTPAEYYRRVRPGDELKIGRGSKNHIIIANPCVSREHGIVRWDASGLTLSDLRTRNGTKVNKLRVVRDVSLKVGDCIEISSARIHVLAPDSAPPDEDAAELSASDSTTTLIGSMSSIIEAHSGVQRKLGALQPGEYRSDPNHPRILSPNLWRKIALIGGGCGLGLGLFWILLMRSL